jgi:hypothetical protein
MQARRREEVRMTRKDPGRSPASDLIYEIGRAAQTSWAQTARLIALLAVAAAAVALILMTSR